MNYMKIAYIVLKQPGILKPKQRVENMTKINYEDLLYKKKIKYLVFDKDNTLSLTYNEDFYSEEIREKIF